MSQWYNICQNGLYNAAAALYQNFPIAVRGELADWLEEHMISSQLNPDVDSERCFYGFMMEMTAELERRINAITNIGNEWLTHKSILQSNLLYIQQCYGGDPTSLFRTVKNYLDQERRLLDPSAPENLGAAGVMMKLKERIAPTSSLSTLMLKKDNELRITQSLVNILHNIRQRLAEIIDNLNALLPNGTANCQDQLYHEMLRTQEEMSQKVNDFNRSMAELGRLTCDIFQQISSLNEDALKVLDQWTVEQRRAANGFPIERNLDDIEALAVFIAQRLVQMYHDVLKAEEAQKHAVYYTQMEYPTNVLQHHNEMKKQILDLIEALVIKSFIVEIQPFQIIRSKPATTRQRLSTSTNPSVKLRLLVGSALNPSLTVPVKASLINEKDAKNYHKKLKTTHQSKVKLVYDQTDLCRNKDTQKFVAEFRGISLASKIERRTKKAHKSVDKKEEESVAAEKWCFFFKSEFTVLEKKISLETSSIPVCITCHPNQDYISWGSLVWDNEFAEPNRVPFDVPNEVSCERLLNVISQKFNVHTGRGLSDDHKRYLRHKLLSLSSGNDPVNDKVSREMFNKKPVTTIKTQKGDKPVTFWEYIYEILKLCEQSTGDDKQGEANHHFQKYWAEGKVEGFIFENEYKKKLEDTKCDGTFMLRFSDNCPGSVTVIFYTSQSGVQKLEPYSLDELSKGIPLWSRISTKSFLSYLYPKIPKSTAFPETSVAKNPSKLNLYKLGYIKTFNEERADISPLRSRNVSTSSASTGTSWFPSSCPSSQSAFTPHSEQSVESLHSPSFGYQEYSDNSTTQDRYNQSSSMDEDEAACSETKL